MSTASCNLTPAAAMPPEKLKNQRLVCVFVFGWILFNHPILALFGRPVTWGGVPLLYAYIFLLWALVIGLTMLITRRGPPPADGARNPPC